MARIDTVIVGGGQAGLATSYYLTQQGREHIVLEQAARAANVWRNERWDSFTLVTPNWTLKMPGAEYDGADRDGDRFALPVHYNARVLSIEPMDDAGYRVVTAECTYAVSNVVIATGFEQHPRIPSFAAGISASV